MRYIKRQDAFSRMTDERYEPDTSIYCAICGGGIFWPGEAVDFNEKGEICHLECLENAKEKPRAETQSNGKARI